jgi:hypothetical protein
VSVISVFEDVSGEQRVLHQSAEFNGVIGTLLWFIAVGFASVFLQHTRVQQITCAQIPMLHESDTLEFKSSLRWNYETAKADPVMERQVVKAVAGFLNSFEGGTLVIGLNDQNKLLGLEPDYSSLRTRPNRDRFEQALAQTWQTPSRMGAAPSASK